MKSAASSWSLPWRSSAVAVSTMRASSPPFAKRLPRSTSWSLWGIVLLKPGSIPKTSSGKVQRHAWPQRLLGRHPGCCGHMVGGNGQGRSGQTPSPLRIGHGRGDGRDPMQAWNSPKAKPSVEPKTEKPAAAEKAPAEQVPEHLDDAATEEIAKVVYQQVRAVGRERARNLAWDTNIVELGLDSLERMEIVAELEELFGGRFPEQVLLDMETCGQVVEAIKTHMGGQIKERKSIPDRFQSAGGRLRLYQVDRIPAAARESATGGEGRARQSVFQRARRRDQRPHPDRRPRVHQLLQLQLPRHVGRSGRDEGSRRRGSQVRDQCFGQPRGVGAKSRSTYNSSGRLPISSARKTPSCSSAGIPPTSRRSATCSALGI